MGKIFFHGREYTVLRESEEYYVCELSDPEIELLVKKSDTKSADDTVSLKEAVTV